MSTTIRRIGISTGGGDCPGLNAVIRGITRTAYGYGWEVLGILDGFDGLLGRSRVERIDPRDIRGILPLGGTILGTTNRGNPFHYPVEENGQVVYRDLSDEVVRRFAALELDALVVIGGDGTLKIALELYRKGLPIVGVPKTIDNDLSATDVTFGFETAVNTATDAIDKLHTTAESHHRAMVLEVMGRNAGWIALSAGIAGGADVILIPEIPFDIDRVCRKVEDRDRRGRKFSIVVVAEGARPAGGTAMGERQPDGSLRLGGIGQVVADGITAGTNNEVRLTVLGHLQRGGTPTPGDRLLASRYGVAAAQLVAEGGFGRMVALRTPDIIDVPLEDAVTQMKAVPVDGDLVRTARALGIELGG
ncbi:MAG TPA: ATP-dependent 6-phosphofructokinase [Armatimonadetes bacterium]|nr:ATP-dependent 6-phosphofructokinase [Armatimonadota bacterium]